MRTIKYRGWNLKNEKWIYGYYLQNRGAHFVCPDEFAYSKSWEDYEVVPESIGQFTGLVDRNGKDIYEGDIIQTDRYVCWVAWNKERCQFELRHHKQGFIETLWELYSDQYETIGNIYKKSETLKQTGQI